MNQSQAQPAQQPFRILAVDDDESVRDMIARYLGDNELSVTTLGRVRESSDIPIIMLTGRKDEADRVMGLELGAGYVFAAAVDTIR